MEWATDLECTTEENDCRCWAWGMLSMQGATYYRGTELHELLIEMSKHPNDTFYFHNVRYDGTFILHYLLTHGFLGPNTPVVRDEKGKIVSCETTNSFRPLNYMEFTTLITDDGRHYMYRVNLWGATVKIVDSFKLIPYAIEQFPKKFGLEEHKGKIDYRKNRPVGYKPTEEEWEYLRLDVSLLKQGLEFFSKRKLNKITIGSNALKDYKSLQPLFDTYFPQIKCDSYLRKAYRGGYCIVNPLYKGKDIIECGYVIDKNSMYPTMLKYKPMPIGEGVYFEGEYKFDKDFPLYVSRIETTFKLKPNYLPIIQLKNNYRFNETEYLTESGEEPVLLTLTNIDLGLFLEHYNIDNITYIDGFKFSCTTGLFDTYIDEWFKVKEEGDLKGIEGLRTLAKLMLNNLYGKFAMRLEGGSKEPYIDEDNILRYRTLPKTKRKGVYLPVGMYTTAYAREDLIRWAQSHYFNFLYADTDSLHMKGLELPTGIPIHHTKLGAWDLEYCFCQGKYLRAKTYIEQKLLDNKLVIRCAGMPNSCHSQVTWENFVAGSCFSGKLQAKNVKGGQILIDTTFTIKA